MGRYANILTGTKSARVAQPVVPPPPSEEEATAAAAAAAAAKAEAEAERKAAAEQARLDKAASDAAETAKREAEEQARREAEAAKLGESERGLDEPAASGSDLGSRLLSADADLSALREQHRAAQEAGGNRPTIDELETADKTAEILREALRRRLVPEPDVAFPEHQPLTRTGPGTWLRPRSLPLPRVWAGETLGPEFDPSLGVKRAQQAEVRGGVTPKFEEREWLPGYVREPEPTEHELATGYAMLERKGEEPMLTGGRHFEPGLPPEEVRAWGSEGTAGPASQEEALVRADKAIDARVSQLDANKLKTEELERDPVLAGIDRPWWTIRTYHTGEPGKRGVEQKRAQLEALRDEREQLNAELQQLKRIKEGTLRSVSE